MSLGSGPDAGPPSRPDPPSVSDLMPFAALVGVKALSVDAAEVRLSLEWAPERCTAGGILHGGAVMALADSAGGWLAYLNLPPGAAGTTTVESSTRLLRPVSSGTVTATARVLHKGRRVVVVDTEVHAEDGHLVGRTTQTQLVLTDRS